MYCEVGGGLKRTKRTGHGDGRWETWSGRDRGTETCAEKERERGKRPGAPDSRYLITDIASPLAPPPPSSPLFHPRPEQMFAPRCRGQIAARTNGRPVLQETASCLPLGTLRVHTHTYMYIPIFVKRAAPIARGPTRIPKEAIRSSVVIIITRSEVCVRSRAPSAFYDDVRCKGMRFRSAPGETYRTSGALQLPHLVRMS